MRWRYKILIVALVLGVLLLSGCVSAHSISLSAFSVTVSNEVRETTKEEGGQYVRTCR